MDSGGENFEIILEPGSWERQFWNNFLAQRARMQCWSNFGKIFDPGSWERQFQNNFLSQSMDSGGAILKTLQPGPWEHQLLNY